MVTPWNLGPPKMDFSPIGDLGKTFQQSADAARKRALEEQQRLTYASAGSDIERGDYAGAARKVMGIGDLGGGVSLLGLGQKAKESEREAEWYRNNGSLIGVPTGLPASSTPATSTPHTYGNFGSPNEVETQFIDTVKGAGLNNPIGLAAVAAYGRAESGFSPGNVNRTWSDPSASGQAGTSGGTMSWRADRLQNLQRFAASRGEQGNGSPATQAMFFAQEDPTLIPRLNAAKTPEEANSIMANAWRFAGYDKPGGENGRRLALTKHYASRFGNAGGETVPAPSAVASAPLPPIGQAVQAEAGGPSAGVYAQSSTEQLQGFLQHPNVPENLKTLMRQELARREGGGPVPVQVAQAAPEAGGPVSDAANIPAPGAVPAQGFAIPGTGEVVETSIANDPKVQRLSRALIGAPERARPGLQAQLNVAIEDAKAKREEAKRIEERRYQEGKTPEAAREWQWARQQGLTTAKSPTAYAAELAAAKRAPDDDTSPLRKEIQQLPSYKNLSQAAPIYRSMFDTAGRNTKASDLNLVYGLGKIMDPTSVVREGEMVLVQNSAGLSEKLIGAIKALQGGAALTEETRKALMAEAYSRMDTYRQQFDQDMTQYRGIVQRRGYNADDVIPNTGEFKLWQPAPKAATASPAAQPAAPLPEGPDQQYVRPDGSSPPTPSAVRSATPRIPNGATPEQVRTRFKSGTKIILPDGSEGVVP